MIGVGRAYGAITFVNALPTGVGAAAGIDLPVTASVELASSAGPAPLKLSPADDSPLVRAVISASLARWASAGTSVVRAEIRSRIPPSQGLKSSSAVAGAISRAIAVALDAAPSDHDVAVLGADVSQSIGLSATGAFDDGMAALSPGLHLTDNVRRLELRRDAIPPSWGLVLWIPPRHHRPSPTYRARFRELREAGESIVRLARAGDPIAAMTANTQLVESALGLDYGAIRARAKAAGAVAAGVSGMGPTLALITPPECLSETLRTLPRGQGEVVVTRFSRAPEGNPR